MDDKRNYCVYISFATYLSPPPRPNHVKEWTTRGIIVYLHQLCHLLKSPPPLTNHVKEWTTRGIIVYLHQLCHLLKSPPPPSQIMSRNGLQEESLSVYISFATYLSPPPHKSCQGMDYKRNHCVFTSVLPPT